MAGAETGFSRQEWRDALTAAGWSADQADDFSRRLVAAQSRSANGRTVGIPALVFVCLAELSHDARARVRAMLALLSPDDFDELCRVEPRLKALCTTTAS